jgi:hypothetical protein
MLRNAPPKKETTYALYAFHMQHVNHHFNENNPIGVE